MKKAWTLLALAALFSFQMHAQDTAKPAEMPKYGWARVGGLGFDLSGIGLINPRVGSGGNRFGLGGLGTYSAKLKEEKHYWDNDFSAQLSVQKLDGQDVQKNLDLFRATSRYGLKKINDKIYFSLEGLFQTGILTTYTGNFLKQSAADGTKRGLLAKFLAPALFQLSPGIDYKPNAKYSIFVSPASYRLIYVGDDAIAALNVHGNDVGKNNSQQFGASVVVKYTNKYFHDRVAAGSELNLYSNYLKNPQNIDVFWKNNISIAIFKGLSLDLLGTLFYDDDVKVQFDRNNNGVYELAKRPEYVGSFLLKYSTQF